MIVSTPVLLPKLAPDDWARWNELWDEHAQPLTKTGTSPNSPKGLWTGFDVYALPEFRPVYQAPLVDLKSLYSQVWVDLWRGLPVTGVTGIRFVQSHGAFPPHIDNFMPSWQLRCLFDCDDAPDHWYYTSVKDDDRKQLELPPETNWFAYYDGMVKHGTTYHEGRRKILLQVFGTRHVFDPLVQRSIDLFQPQYTIDYDA